MNKMAKKVRQMLTMLLAVSMLAGSIPMNAFAMEGLNNEMEMTAVLEDSLYSGDLVSGNDTVSDNDSASDNEPGSSDEETTQIEITFSVAGVENANSQVDIIQIIRDKDGNISERVTLNQETVTTEKGQPFEFELKLKEGYKVSEVKAGITILGPTEGIYSAKLSDSGTIEITLAELDSVNVTFFYDEKQINNLTVFADEVFTTVEDGVPVKVEEKSDITFEFKLEDKVIVKNVTVNGEAAPEPTIDSKEKSYRYKLGEPVTEDLEIKIETSLDEKQCYILDLAVIGHKNSVQVYYDGKPYKHGGRILMTEPNGIVSIYEEEEEYKITQVLLGEEKLTGIESKYNVVFSDDAIGVEKAQALIIYTEPEISEDKKKIIFANSSEHVTYEVNIYAPEEPEKVIVTKDPLKKDTYTIQEKTSYLEFYVTYEKGYGADIGIPDGILYDLKVQENETTYTETYSLVVKTLGDEENPTIITISEYTPVKTISVLYDKDRMESLQAIVDGKYVEGTDGYDSVKDLEKLNFEYPYGTQIVFDIKTRDEYILSKIVETVGKKESVEKEPQEKEYRYTAKVDSNKNIELQLEGAYTTELYYDSKAVVKEEEIYSVEGGNEYTVYLYKGEKIPGNRQIVSRVALKNGTAVVSEKSVSATEMKVKVPETDSAGKSLAGKTLTLEIDYKESGQTYTHKEQLKVLQETQITSITGIKNGKVSQTAGTVKEYTFSSNLSEVEDRFEALVFTAEENVAGNKKEELDRKANENFKAEIVENKLKLTVKTSYEDEKALIKIYEKNAVGEREEVAGGNVLITSKAPAFAEKTKPTVSLKNSTNLNVILSLGMKNLEELGYEEAADGEKTPYAEYWYKIEGEPTLPKDTSKTPEIPVYTEKFTEYVKYTDVSQLGNIQVVDREDSKNKQNTIDYAEGEFPYKTDHKLKVSLIQTTGPIGENEQIEEADIAFESKVVEIKASTKVPSYETKLGVKTVKTSLYSGQKDVIVAYPVFSKATSYQKITAAIKWDSSVENALQDEVQVVVDKDNNILFSAGAKAKAGKYVIEITADVEEGSVPAKKEFTVQVVQGIYQIDLKTPKELYKEYQKAATLKVGIAYNEEDKEDKEDISLPKTKKVEWVLLDYNKEVIDEDHQDYEVYKAFSIKNGVVTIDKDFILSSDTNKNTFYVQAVAKDFERKENEEEIIGISEKIVITNEKVTLGDLALVKVNEKDNTRYDLIAESDYEVAVDKIQGSKLVMLKKGTIEKDWYTESDFLAVSEELEEKLLYSSNSKAVEIKEDKSVSVNDIASGVKITVQTQDGSNVKSELKNLTITHAEAGVLGIAVIQDNMTVLNSFSSGEEIFYGPKDETLTIKILEKDESGDGVPIFGEDCQLKVQGAKIMESNELLGEYKIIGTSDTIVLQLDNKTTGGSKVFTLKNAALNNTEVKNNAALKLKTEGTLETGWFSKEEPQTITYTIPKESIGKYTHAYVTIDKLDYLKEGKEETYGALIYASLGSLGEVAQPGTLETIGALHQLNSNGQVVLNFGAQEGEERYYIPEANFTYKLNIAFGTMTENYEFKAGAKTNAVTIKTKDVKIVNAKLNTSYNMSIKEGGAVTLTLNNKKAELASIGPLMNMNIKGKVNRFTDLFILDGNILRLKTQEELGEGFDLEQLIADKNNLTGYISEYTYTQGNKQKTVYNTVVKIKLKDLVQKYSLSQAIVLAEDVKNAKVDVNVNLLAGKNVVKAKYVYVPENQKFLVSVNQENGSLNFVSKDGVKIGTSNKCTVYVVPEGSYYIPMIAKNGEQTAEFKDAVLEYGIKLTASIAVKSQDKTGGKIKFASNDLKPKFTAEHFVFTNEEELKGVYQLEVPYTVAVEWENENGKEISVSYDKSDVINISKVKGKDAVTITINKQELRSVCESDTRKDSYGNAYGYGKTVTVKAAATFGENTKAETVTFKITLPKQPLQLEEATEILNDYAWSDLDVVLEKVIDGKETVLSKEELITVNRPLIEEVVNEVLSKDGDLKFEIYATDAVVPEENVEGTITYSAELTDLGTQKQSTKYVKAEIKLGKLLKEPKDFMDESGNVPELQKAIDALEPIKNTTSMTDILNEIRKSMGFDTEDSQYKHLRLYAENVERKDATVEHAGYIKGNFCIISMVHKEAEALAIPFEFEIAQLMTLEQAKEAVLEAIKDIKIYHSDIGYNETKAEDILNVANKAVNKHGYDVGIPTPKFEYVDSAKQTEGKITMRIFCEDDDGLKKLEFVYTFEISIE